MKTIQVYDPAMCCSTGICGTSIDPDLANLAGLLNLLRAEGVNVERYNLGQQPLAFAQNPAVKSLLEKEGVEALPVVFLDGEVLFKGHYPTKEERPGFVRAALGKEEVAAS